MNTRVFKMNTVDVIYKIGDTTDYYKYDFPKKLWLIKPTWELAIKISTFIPFIILGIIGNFLLLNIISRNRALKTPINLLLANMSAADLITIIVGPILFMFNDFYQVYQLGPFGCKFEGFLEGALLVTSVFNLVAISYDRLTAIVLPTETRLTVKSTKIVMMFSWIFGFTITIPLAVYRKYNERHWRNFIESYCGEDTTVLPIYWHALISALVWFPLGVMLLCYSAILWKLDRYEKKVLKKENPISVSYKTKAAKTMFIVVLTFILLRVPFTAFIMVRNKLLNTGTMNQITGEFLILYYTAHYLLFINASINPLIYGLTNDNFRRAYHQTPILPTFCRKFTSWFTQKNFQNILSMISFRCFRQKTQDCKNIEKVKPNAVWTLTKKSQTTDGDNHNQTSLTNIKPTSKEFIL